jgi:hypothetical protein
MGKWTPAQVDAALRWYAGHSRSTVIRDVPATAPSWMGWGADVNRRLVAVAVPGHETNVVEYDEDLFGRLVSEAAELRPLLAYGFIDRTGFGHIVTRCEYLKRSWDPSGRVRPVALQSGTRGPSNVADAFEGAGVEIVSLPIDAPPKDARRSGSPPGRNDPWQSRGKGEDRYLHSLWNQRQRRGWWLAEVPVGFVDSPSDSRSRRVDAVVIDNAPQRTSAGGRDIEELRHWSGGRAILVEAKKYLNANAVGQLLSGEFMFRLSYPAFTDISLLACVEHRTDAAMDWFCDRRGIKVELIDLTS